jgi:hypothetical protein
LGPTTPTDQPFGIEDASFEVAGSMNGMLPFRCSEDMTAAAKDVLARFERFF